MVSSGTRRKALVVACILIGSVGVGAMLSPAKAATTDPFPVFSSGFTQDLFAINNGFLGGVAFAPNGDVWTDNCLFGGSALARYSQTSKFAQNGAMLATETDVASNAGCGLTNNPDGFLYSNTDSGVTQIDSNTGAATGEVFGAAGDALGITTDPQTNSLVYVGSDGTILVAPPGGSSSTFSTTTTGDFIDGIAFDPSGNYLFASNRSSNTVTVIARNGSLVQNSGSIAGVPDGISFHGGFPQFVLTNNNDGSMTRLDFPANDFTKTPVLSTFRERWIPR